MIPNVMLANAVANAATIVAANITTETNKLSLKSDQHGCCGELIKMDPHGCNAFMKSDPHGCNAFMKSDPHGCQRQLG